MKSIQFHLFKTLLIVALIAPVSLEAGFNPFGWLSSDGNKDQQNKIITTLEVQEVKANKLLTNAERYASKGKVRREQKIYKKILKKYHKTEAAEAIALKRGEYLFKKNKWVDAFSALTALTMNHPSSSSLEAAIELQYQCADSLMKFVPRKTLGIFKSDPLNDKAIPLFLSFVNFYPYDARAPQALLNVADIAETNGQNEVAIVALKQIINGYSDSALTSDAYFKIAHIYADFIKGPEYDLESTREAIRYCEDYIALFSTSSDIGSIKALYERMLNTLATNRLYMADYYYFNRRDNVAALIFYNEAITLAPDSQAALEARSRLDAIERGVKPTTGRNLIKKILFIR